MADVPGKFYRATKVRTGVSPSSAGSIEGEPLPPVNPPGSSLNSVGLTMPSAFTVSNSPLTANGTIGVAGAGTVSQYIRGDGSLADFPESSGGGGSVSYYLNGSVDQGTIGGVTYKELNKVPILGAGTDFTINADGYIASFITDAGDPNLLEIPGGNWNFETYFSASSGGGSPTFYVELYKVNAGGTATLIASSSTSPELIAFGTNLTPYFSSLAVPTTTLALTDRLAVRYYVTHSGRTITLHTENNHLCQIITTFTTGLTALNGLTAQVQNFAVGTTGTDFNIASAVSTHTFNLPTASATNRGALSSADWALFTQAYNDKINSAAVTGTTTKTLTLTQQDGGTITASWSDLNTDAVLSVFGRTGNVIAVSGDYTTAQVTESGNLYYTDARSRAALSFAAGSGAYNTSTGVITIPTNNNQITNGAGYITSAALAGYLPLSGGVMTGPITTPNSTFGIVIGDDSRLADRDIANTLFVEGVQNTDRGYINFSQTTGNALGAINGGNLTWRGNAVVTGTGTTNYLPKFTGTSTIGNSQVFDNGTNVGIGSDSISNGTTFGGGGQINRLKLQSSNYTCLEINGSTSGGSIQFTYGTNLPNQVSGLIGYNYSNGTVNEFSITNILSGPLVFSTENAPRMTILAGGNVGIGTPSPSKRLDIVTNVSQDGIRITGSSNPRLTIIDSTNNVQFDALVTDTEAVIRTDTNHPLHFTTNGVPRMYLNTSGNLGLGVTPSAWLSVYKVIQVGNTSSFFAVGSQAYLGNNAFVNSSDEFAYITSTNASIYRQNVGIHSWFTAPSGTAGNVISFTQAMTLFSTGNLLVGTPSPISDNGARLQVSGNASINGGASTALRIDANSGFAALNIGGTGTISVDAPGIGGGRFFLSDAGNVGIGTASPEALSNNTTLQINGTNHSFVRTGTSNYGGYFATIPTADVLVISNVRNPVTGTYSNTGKAASTISLFSASSNGYIEFNTTATNNSGPSTRMTIASSGTVTINNLAGSGNRIVVANSGGTLISAVIGSGLAFDGTTLTATGGGSGSISGSGTSGTVALFTGSTSIGNSAITQSGSTIGITSATTDSAVTFTNSTAYSTSNTYSLTYRSTTASFGIQPIANIIFDTVGDAASRIRFVTRANAPDYDTRMTITSVGNVGISTTNPDDYGAGYKMLAINGSTAGILQLRSGNSPTINMVGTSTSADFEAFLNKTITFKTGTSSVQTRMTITSGGNVGIGTPSPSEILHVYRATTFATILLQNGNNSAYSLYQARTNNSDTWQWGCWNDNSYRVGRSGIADHLTITSGGNVLVNTTTDNGNKLRVNGTIFSDSSITATSFFESSDATLKTLVEDNYQAKGIDSVVAKLYIKNGKEELGYFAQDLQGVLPSAVIKGSDGLLNLSYREVHTAKIAYLEEEIKQIKKRYEIN